LRKMSIPFFIFSRIIGTLSFSGCRGSYAPKKKTVPMEKIANTITDST